MTKQIAIIASSVLEADAWRRKHLTCDNFRLVTTEADLVDLWPSMYIFLNDWWDGSEANEIVAAVVRSQCERLQVDKPVTPTMVMS